MLLNEIERFNRLKRQQIAYELNIQPETLSRILKKFERKGYIAYDDDHHLVIANEEELIGMINDA
jgi:CRP/FNR family transcriptional regulator